MLRIGTSKETTKAIQKQYPQFAHLFENDFYIKLYLDVLRMTDSEKEAREAVRVARAVASQLDISVAPTGICA